MKIFYFHYPSPFSNSAVRLDFLFDWILQHIFYPVHIKVFSICSFSGVFKILGCISHSSAAYFNNFFNYTRDRRPWSFAGAHCSDQVRTTAQRGTHRQPCIRPLAIRWRSLLGHASSPEELQRSTRPPGSPHGLPVGHSKNK